MDSRAISGVVGGSLQSKPEERGKMEVEINEESVTNLIRHIARGILLERAKQPFSMLAPEPFHFPRFSKLNKPWVAVEVKAEGLEMDMLHDIYGMPRNVPLMILTMSGAAYGREFDDFSIEFFGIKGDTTVLEENQNVEEPNRRIIGDHIQASNVADLNTIPYGAGGSHTIINNETGECVVKIHPWRWRVFMDNSSLCLENNWHLHPLTGGGWISYILGIAYGNPEKMVADVTRFAPAFKLCNLVEAKLSEKRSGYQVSDIESWTEQAIEKMAQESVKTGKIIPYSFTRFSQAFPLATTRTNIYNFLTPNERSELEGKYLKRCNELLAK